MLFLCNLNFLNDLIYEELQKRWRKVSGSQKESKANNYRGLPNFAAQKSPPAKMALLCEIISHLKGTRCEIKGLLRNMPSSAKQFRSPIAPLCENFRSYETALWHTSVISQPKPHFAAGKPTFGTRVPFCSLKPSFRSCENGPLLQKWAFAAKCPLLCEKSQSSLGF